jgi:ferredoxin
VRSSLHAILWLTVAALAWLVCLGVVLPVVGTAMVDSPVYETLGAHFEPLAALPHGRLDRFGFEPSVPLNAFVPRTQIRDTGGNRLPLFSRLWFVPGEVRHMQGLAFGIALGCLLLYPICHRIDARRRRNSDERRRARHPGRFAVAAASCAATGMAGAVGLLALRIGWSHASWLRGESALRFDAEGVVVSGGGVYYDGDLFFAIGPEAHAALLLGVMLAVMPAGFWAVRLMARVPPAPDSCDRCGYPLCVRVCPECGSDASRVERRPDRLRWCRVLFVIGYLVFTVGMLLGPWSITVTLGPLLAWINR